MIFLVGGSYTRRLLGWQGSSSDVGVATLALDMEAHVTVLSDEDRSSPPFSSAPNSGARGTFRNANLWEKTGAAMGGLP